MSTGVVWKRSTNTFGMLLIYCSPEGGTSRHYSEECLEGFKVMCLNKLLIVILIVLISRHRSSKSEYNWNISRRMVSCSAPRRATEIGPTETVRKQIPSTRPQRMT